jgi:hypothetical protein
MELKIVQGLDRIESSTIDDGKNGKLLYLPYLIKE